jgi:hypothetical protein
MYIIALSMASIFPATLPTFSITDHLFHHLFNFNNSSFAFGSRVTNFRFQFRLNRPDILFEIVEFLVDCFENFVLIPSR